MPNWCDNNVTLKGEKEVLDWIEEIQFDFKKLLPVPEYPKFKLKTQYWDWDWCKENWGTKWEADNPAFDRKSDKELFINFQTAWGPPEGIYGSLIGFKLDIEASYIEEGMMFYGTYRTNKIMLDDIPFRIDLNNYHYRIPSYDREVSKEDNLKEMMDLIEHKEDKELLKQFVEEYIDCRHGYLEQLDSDDECGRPIFQRL